jgi:hypothetical protein
MLHKSQHHIPGNITATKDQKTKRPHSPNLPFPLSTSKRQHPNFPPSFIRKQMSLNTGLIKQKGSVIDQDTGGRPERRPKDTQQHNADIVGIVCYTFFLLA